MDKFWKWKNRTVLNKDTMEASVERTLFLNGVIAEDSWLDDDVTPKAFRDELNSGKGDVTVWINSPGGDCFAAAQIYNMLREYAGKITIKIDGLAASAASVIAMAGDEVLVSPVSMLMIHNPATMAWGDVQEMNKAIEMLDSVKDSIIDAYVAKTGLSRGKLSALMDDETWMDSRKAVELHFADGIMERAWKDEDDEDELDAPKASMFSRHRVAAAMNKKLIDHFKEDVIPEDGRSVKELEDRLYLIKNQF